VFDEVCILFHFNIILKPTRCFPLKKKRLNIPFLEVLFRLITKSRQLRFPTLYPLSVFPEEPCVLDAVTIFYFTSNKRVYYPAVSIRLPFLQTWNLFIYCIINYKNRTGTRALSISTLKWQTFVRYLYEIKLHSVVFRHIGTTLIY
jgi:hypothetical protein